MKALVGLILILGIVLVIASMVWPPFDPETLISVAEKENYDRAIFTLHSTESSVTDLDRQTARDISTSMVQKLKTAQDDYQRKLRVMWGAGLAATLIGICLFALGRGRPQDISEEPLPSE